MARFLFYPGRALEQYRSLLHLGEVWYNLKTNPRVGKVLARETDARFVVTGRGNLERLDDTSRGIFLVQGESREELARIYDGGIGGFIVDNENEFELVREFAAEVPVFIRIRAKEHTIYTGKYFVYGIRWDRVSGLIGSQEGHFGIHFHRKTQNIGEWSLVEDFSNVLDSLEGKIEAFNIGGGIPFHYHNSSPPLEPIFRQIGRFRDHLRERGLKLVMEPGRFIAAPSVELETKVLNAYGGNLVVDASLYNAYPDTMLFGVRLPVRGEADRGHRYLIKGCSPDSLDIFRYKVFFPEPKGKGDTVTFLNAGAYNFRTEFSDLPEIPVELMK